ERLEKIQCLSLPTLPLPQVSPLVRAVNLAHLGDTIRSIPVLTLILLLPLRLGLLPLRLPRLEHLPHHLPPLVHLAVRRATPHTLPHAHLAERLGARGRLPVDEPAPAADEHDAVLGRRLVLAEEEVHDPVVPVRLARRTAA